MRIYLRINNNQKLVEQLEQQNFENLKLDCREFTSWVEIEDKNHGTILSKCTYEEKEQFCIIIYEMKQPGKDKLLIPLSEIETIYELR